MKKRSIFVFCLSLCVIMVVLAGCETARSVDNWLTDADNWVKEVAW